MDNNNAEKFLALFNKTEKWMKNELKTDNRVGYSLLLKEIKNKHPVIRRYYDELKVYGDLRNLMVHEKIDPSYYLTYPSSEIVQKFKLIYEELTKPEKVIPKFKKEVVTFNTLDYLSSVLEKVKKERFTNFPVYGENGLFKGLLTDNGLTHWLSSNVEEDLISISETTIEDVMPLEEEKENYTFVDRNLSIYEAKEKFEKYNIRLDALLITEHGKKHERLLGIITSWDI